MNKLIYQLFTWGMARGSWFVTRGTNHQSRIPNHEPPITNHESRYFASTLYLKNIFAG